MIKPSENVVRAFINLENNIPFQEIMGWISESLRKQSSEINKLEGENTIKMQGKNLALEEILNHFEKRFQYKENFKKNKEE